ncbi:MAG: dTDP-glucose 4,6-dehydratase [Gemmatimonadaceae bacterium]
MRKLLVTGGAGFIGSNFVYYWTEHHTADVVVVLDVLTYAGNRTTIFPLIDEQKITFTHGDIVDAQLVGNLLLEHDIDTIVHFAAESHVDRSIVDPGAFVRTNVVGTQVLLDAAVQSWRADNHWKPGVRFHHVSTDEVYGSLEPADAPFTEQTPYAPSSPYAASKAGSDHLVRAYTHTYGLPTSISNCSNNYGPYQFPEKLIPLMIVNALHGKSLPLYGDGHQVRDWLYVEDHCAAIDKMLHASVAGETFNVGGRAERTNIDIVHNICALIDHRFANHPLLASKFPDCPAARGTSTASLISFVKDRPGHDRRYAIDPSRISDALQFEPSETIGTGLARTVDWYLSHHEWWIAVQDGSYRTWISQQYGNIG